MPYTRTPSTSPESLVNTWMQPETITGIIALAFLATMGYHSWNRADNLWSTAPQSASQTQSSVQQIITAQTATLSAEIVATQSITAATPVAAESTTAAIDSSIVQEVAPSPPPTTTSVAPPALQGSVSASLPSTGTTVTARINDTFWDIARRTCGQGIQGYRIKEENGYARKHLHPGDEIVVTCN